jgi:hypothetical protein
MGLQVVDDLPVDAPGNPGTAEDLVPGLRQLVSL